MFLNEMALGQGALMQFGLTWQYLEMLLILHTSRFTEGVKQKWPNRVSVGLTVVQPTDAGISVCVKSLSSELCLLWNGSFLEENGASSAEMFGLVQNLGGMTFVTKIVRDMDNGNRCIYTTRRPWYVTA